MSTFVCFLNFKHYNKNTEKKAKSHYDNQSRNIENELKTDK